MSALIKGLLLSTLTCLLVNMIWGSHYEYIEILFSSLIDGSFHGIHFGNLYFMANWQIQKFYVWLYTISPDILWYPLAFTTYMLLAGAVIFSSIFRQFRSKNMLWQLPILLTISALIATHWVSVQHTRISILLVTAAWWLHNGYAAQAKRWWHLPVALLLYLTGVLTRTESALAATALLMLLSVCKTQSLLLPVVKNIPLLSILAVVLLHISYHIYFTPAYHWQLEPELEYEIIERGNIKPLSLNATPNDSARYMAATQWFLGDSGQVNPTYLRNLLLPHPPPILPLVQILNNIQESVAYILPYLIALCSLLLLTGKRFSIYHLLYLVAGIAILLLPAATIKVDPHVIQPLATIWLAGLALLIISSSVSISIETLALVGLVISSSIIFCDINKVAQSYSKTESEARQFIEYVNTSYPQKKIWYCANYNVLAKSIWQAPIAFTQKLFFVDMAQLTYLPEATALFKKTYPCGSYDFACRIHYLQSQTDSLIIVGDENRLQLYQYYVDRMYGIQLNYQLLKEFPEINTGIYKLYSLPMISNPRHKLKAP